MDKLSPAMQGQLMTLFMNAATGALSRDQIKAQLIPIAAENEALVTKFLKPEYTSQLCEAFSIKGKFNKCSLGNQVGALNAYMQKGLTGGVG